MPSSLGKLTATELAAKIRTPTHQSKVPKARFELPDPEIPWYMRELKEVTPWYRRERQVRRCSPSSLSVLLFPLHAARCDRDETRHPATKTVANVFLPLTERSQQRPAAVFVHPREAVFRLLASAVCRGLYLQWPPWPLVVSDAYRAGCAHCDSCSCPRHSRCSFRYRRQRSKQREGQEKKKKGTHSAARQRTRFVPVACCRSNFCTYRHCCPRPCHSHHCCCGDYRKGSNPKRKEQEEEKEGPRRLRQKQQWRQRRQRRRSRASHPASTVTGSSERKSKRKGQGQRQRQSLRTRSLFFHRIFTAAAKRRRGIGSARRA
ncbi:hypothetical protein B0T24DRAFT_12990 [Lasiosphaeria ovina]|uniref:Uncharacterized protein n=1 Tax=Lasiosphaeria ovina TaxID=92902 RepID=A0AAE0TWV0_9PEZI|nr:hypothetical protein B0T24DRAFT_12990 [Lasiosphaeria ovina]